MAAAAAHVSDGRGSGPERKRKRSSGAAGGGGDDDSDAGDAIFGYTAAMPRPGAPALSLDELRSRLATRIDLMKRSRESKKEGRGGPAGDASAAAAAAGAMLVDGEAVGEGHVGAESQKKRKQRKRKQQQQEKPKAGGAASATIASSSSAPSSSSSAAARTPSAAAASAASTAAAGARTASQQQGQKRPRQEGGAAETARPKQQQQQQRPQPRTAAMPPSLPLTSGDSAVLDFAFGAIASAAPAAATSNTGTGSGADADAPRGSKKGKLKHLLKKAQAAKQRLDRLAEAGLPQAKLDANFSSALKRAEVRGEGGRVGRGRRAHSLWFLDGFMVLNLVMSLPSESARSFYCAACSCSSNTPSPLLPRSVRSAVQGEKPMDDPHLIAKALKRMQKTKAKSSAAWAERKVKEDGDQVARQAFRDGNIAKKKLRGLNEKGKAAAAKAAEKKASHKVGGLGGEAAAGAGAAAATAAPAAAGGAAKSAGRPSSGTGGGGRAGFEGQKKSFLNQKA